MNSINKTTPKKKDLNYSSWLYGCAIVPVVIGFGVYVYALLFLGIEHAFFTTLGAGDLISLSAMMLIAVHVEIRHVSLPDSTKENDLLKDTVLWLPMIFWCAYGLIKCASIKYVPEMTDPIVKFWTAFFISGAGVLAFGISLYIGLICRKSFIENVA